MKLLLDTHVALWSMIGSARLSKKAVEFVSDPSADLFVSIASIWEVGIKHSLARGGPSDVPVSAADLARLLRGARCELLPVKLEHVIELETLPSHHRDPFDRMLVAQARAEPMRLLTVDRMLAAYGPPVELV